MSLKKEDEIRCPHCSNVLKERKGSCPRCGYTGYIPMSESQAKRIKLIIYPIALVLAIVLVIVFSKCGA